MTVEQFDLLVIGAGPGGYVPAPAYGFDPILELPDRASHQMNAGLGVDRNIDVRAANIVDRIDRNSDESAGAADPEFALIGLRAILAGRCPEIANDPLQLLGAMLGIDGFHPKLDAGHGPAQPVSLDRFQ